MRLFRAIVSFISRDRSKTGPEHFRYDEDAAAMEERNAVAERWFRERGA